MHMHIIHYYQVDDTVEIQEVHEPNDGRDPFPVFLCRQKLSKDHWDIPCETSMLLTWAYAPAYNIVITTNSSSAQN